VHSYNARYLETIRDLQSCDITTPFRLVMSQTLRGLLFLPGHSSILAASAPRFTHNRGGTALNATPYLGHHPSVAARRRKDMSTKAITHQTRALFACWKLLTAILHYRRMPAVNTPACSIRRQSSLFDYGCKRIDSGMIRQDDINTAPRRWGMKVLPIP